MKKKFNPLGALLGVGVLLTFSGLAQAVTKTWVGSTTGSWNTASRWSPPGVPQNGDDVIINANGTYTVNYNPPTVNSVPQTDFRSLTIGGGTGTQTLSKGGNNLNTTDGITIESSGVLTQTNGTIGGSGNITVNGTFNLNGGTVTTGGTFDVSNGGTLALGPNTKTIQRDVNNSGTISWPTGTGALQLAPGVAIINNGTFNIGANGPITRIGNSLAANASITNNGTFTKTGGGTTQLNAVSFINAGTTEISGNGSTLAVGSAIYTQNSGSTALGTGSTLRSPSIITFAGGNLTGTGTVSGSLSNTGGTIAPGATAGSVGTLTVTNSYIQGNAASYNADITGATTHDALSVGGAATLNGTLNANVTYTVQGGEVFPVLTYSSRSGAFSTINENGALVDPQYTANALNLIGVVLTATITTPQDNGYVTAPQKVVGNITRFPLVNGNTGLQGAQITILENNTGLYWNGTAFVAGPISFLSEFINASNGGFGTNEGPGTLDVTDGYTYTITSTVTDVNGNTAGSNSVTVTSDKLRPSITSDNAPAHRSTISSLPTLTGTATDPNSTLGTSSGLRDVRLTLIRQSDKFYWNGSSWQAVFVQVIDSAATSAPDAVSPVSYSFSNLPQVGVDPQTDLTPGSYSLSIVSYDRTGKNSSAASISRTFTVGVLPPPQNRLQSSPSGGSS